MHVCVYERMAGTGSAVMEPKPPALPPAPVIQPRPEAGGAVAHGHDRMAVAAHGGCRDERRQHSSALQWGDRVGSQAWGAATMGLPTEHGLRLTPVRPQGHRKPRPPTAGGSFRGVTARGTRRAVSALGTGRERKLSTGRPRVLAAGSLLREREELRSAGQVSPRFKVPLPPWASRHPCPGSAPSLGVQAPPCSRSCSLPGHLGTATPEMQAHWW